MRPNLLVATLGCLLFNTAIAGLLTLVSFESRFPVNLVFSQCIGLSIFGINTALMYRFQDRRRWLILPFSFPFSIVLGVALGAWITGLGGWHDPRSLAAVVIGLFFGGIGGITYFLVERIDRMGAAMKHQQLMRSETERRELLAQLKLLQAQIEPHFLFNTLANVGSLIDSRPRQARQLLDRLNDWLRVALGRARSEHGSLGDELDMLENYLEILTIRYGERLRWSIDADDGARGAAFPPMLLQPLVENAVRHGIEPKIGGGMLEVRARREQGRLHIQVSDDGVGLRGEAGVGDGIANVQARLAALYGGSGSLTLETNTAGGVTATLELPS